VTFTIIFTKITFKSNERKNKIKELQLELRYSKIEDFIPPDSYRDALLELRCWNCVVGTSLIELRCLIGTIDRIAIDSKN
jgi:hypothetical protein